MGEDSNRTTLTVVTQVVALTAFYLYFGGWVYTKATLAAYSLDHAALATPVYFYIVYAYSVFFTTFFGWLLLLGIAAAWYVVARLRFILTAEIVIVVLLATVPFPLIRALATSRANADVSYLRSGRATPVKIKVKQSELSGYPEELFTASNDGSLRLALQTEDHYYVFVQPPGESGQLPRATMYTLRSDDVALIVSLDNIAASKD